MIPVGTRIASLAAMLALVIAAGCGGGGNDGVTGQPPPQAPPPAAAELVAVAGADSELASVSSTSTVALSAARSFFRTSPTTTRAPSATAWALVASPAGAVAPTIASPNTAATNVTFPASPVVGTYTFRATVTEGNPASGTAQTATDDVDVFVKTTVITPIADRIAVGFSAPGQAASTITIGPIATTGAAPASITVTGVTGTSSSPSIFKNPRIVGSNFLFDAPTLEELQTLPDEPALLGMWRRSGAYNRITVQAKDASGAVVDFEEIIVSLAVPTTGLRVVPVNVPVYVNLGSAVGDQWVVNLEVAPNTTLAVSGLFDLRNAAITPVSGGTATQADFNVSGAARRVVYFIPKVEGEYRITIDRMFTTETGTTASETTSFEVAAGQYVSDGLRGTATANPDIGNCAACHAGQVSFLKDKVTPWLASPHGSVSLDRRAFTPANVTPGAHTNLNDLAPELYRQVTGFYLGRTGGGNSAFTGANAGFDDMAANISQPSGLSEAELEKRNPEAYRLVGKQCETCHGPGNLHLGDTAGIDISYRVDSCARCHTSEPQAWANSKHEELVASPASNTSCVRCHTSAGATDPIALSYQYSTDPATSPPGGAVRIPGGDGRMNTATCATCHDPHGNANHALLRVSGDFTMPSGNVIAAGDAAQCLQCHNSRRSWQFNLAQARKGEPHPSAQGDVLTGTNGAEFAGFAYNRSAHGDPQRFRFNDGSQAKFCITCHMATPDSARSGKLGEHSFAVRLEGETPGNDLVNDRACTQCHTMGTTTSPRGQEFNVSASGDWDGDGTREIIQREVAGLLNLLGGVGAAPTAENPFGIVHGTHEDPVDPIVSGAIFDLARTQAIATALGLTNGETVDQLYGSHGALFVHTSAGRELNIPKGPAGEVLFKAMWNYFLLLEDKSYGLHNTGYTVGLLQSSLIEIRKTLGQSPSKPAAMELYAPFKP